MKVAFQGIQGAYSELAVYAHFGKGVETVGCESFEEVFEAVARGRAERGVIPVENTIAGTVVENYDLLLNTDSAIIAEIYLPIRHTLLAPTGVALDDVRKAYSHPHALKQCREFLKTRGIRPVPVYDTAGAARQVAGWHRQDRAAIASELCAEIYGMQILARDIQSNRSNTTRFFVIVPKDQIPHAVRCEKTTVAFKTRHYPGALVDCLKIFQQYRLNLTQLESRPIPENPWEYVFYAAFEAGVKEERTGQALSELRRRALFVKVLGSYAMAEKCW
jgi:prephenate dehydratase